MLLYIKCTWRTMNSNTEINVKWKRTEKRIELSFLGLVILVVVVVGIVTSGGFETTSMAVVPVTSTAFAASVTRVGLVDQRSVSVKYSIKNSGASPATSNCTIVVQDPSGSFPSFSAAVTPRLILAGHTVSSKMIIAIAGPGPQYVTQGKIHCT